jgi:Transmembrane secretion effector
VFSWRRYWPAPLAEREFRLLFVARTVSSLGGAVAPVGLAFAVLDLTGSKADLGYVLAARAVPTVVFILFGGVWADRLPRHLVMVACNVVSGASQALVAALLLSGQAQIWELMALSAVNGASSAFFFPASQGLLQQGNALLRMGQNATLIFGAALGGALVAATSPGVTIAIDAASFLVAAAVTAAMTMPARPPAERSSMLEDLRVGWGEFWSRTWLWAIVLQFGITNAAETGALSVLGPAVAKAHLGGAAAWGAILTCQAVGLIVGGLVILRWRPRRLLLVATLSYLVNVVVLFALAVPVPLALIALAAVVSGAGREGFGINWDTVYQEQIPPDRLSRVVAYDALGSFVLIPIGLAVVGPIAAAIGTRATLYGIGTIIVLATVAVLFSRDVRTIRRRDVADEHLVVSTSV